METALTLEEIYTPIESRLGHVSQRIAEILSSPNELARDVIRYFFSTRGKLLRPALACLGAGLKDITDPRQESRLIDLAASLEIFHAATLIHDDIVDSAYLRRHIPTIHVKWGPDVAVLVGDYLHDKAMGAVFRNGDHKIFDLFLKTGGMVCDGEIRELKEKYNFDLEEDGYFEIIEKKTASLLACAVTVGGILAGVSETEEAALVRFGKNFGKAFQIVDDCLDFTGNEHEFGKTLGADCSAGVVTLPVIRLIQVAEPSDKNEIAGMFKSGMSGGEFQRLLRMIRGYRTIEYSLEKAAEFSALARSELGIFNESPARCSLGRLVDYILERNR
ncbi:MAG: polyprenyl synthetase family protein [Candidatus Omnitrophica bacterium]|nr:polyprenyl synthetase family protein [Candidatus Omnitrophota bacterium]